MHKIFIPESNEPSSRACVDIWRMPREIKNGSACCGVFNLIEQVIQAVYLFLPSMDRVKQGISVIPKYWHQIQKLPLLYKSQTQFCNLLVTACINQVLVYLFILLFCLCHFLLPPSEPIINFLKYNIKYI